MLPYIAYMDPMGYIEWSIEAMRSQTLAPSPLGLKGGANWPWTIWTHSDGGDGGGFPN